MAPSFNATRMTFGGLLFVLCALSALLSACGGSDGSVSESSNTGSIVIALKWEVSPVKSAGYAALSPGRDVCVDYGIEEISAEVFDSPDTVVASATWPCSAHQGTVEEVPAGSDMYVIVDGMIGDACVWRGQQTGITVVANQNTDAGTVTMNYVGDDQEPPEIEEPVYPPHLAVDVPLNAALKVRFKEKMVLSSIRASTCTCAEKDTGNPVNGTMQYDVSTQTITFTPASLLLPSTTYVGTISGDVEDMAGHNMTDDYVWSFTTVPERVWYRDADGDGYSDGTSQVSVTRPGNDYFLETELTGKFGDCDDGADDVNPGADENCNNVDDDCDGQVDEGVTVSFYRDSDGDGHGDPNNSIEACQAPRNFVTDKADCNDGDDKIFPGAAEVCNHKDDNCDGSVDEGVTLTFYRDSDNDGYGNPNAATQACTAPAGYVADSTDCSDSDSNVNPGVEEICNHIDDNCDGSIDEGVTFTFYLDLDGDGYGNPIFVKTDCIAPEGYVANSTDCNDDNPDIHPGLVEICDGIDNNCNGQIDENIAGDCHHVQGFLEYQRTAMSGITNAVPTFLVRDEADGYPNVATHYDLTDGSYSIYGLPDYSNMTVKFHVIAERDTLPGNFYASIPWDLSDGYEFDIAMKLIIHSIKPWDNEEILETIRPYAVYSDGPLLFEWERVSGAISYSVSIEQCVDSDIQDDSDCVPLSTGEQTTADTSFAAVLEKSKLGEHYRFHLQARDTDSEIGLLTTTFADGYETFYRFRIGSESDFDEDGDVDGSDLATFAAGKTKIGLEQFATEFGNN